MNTAASLAAILAVALALTACESPDSRPGVPSQDEAGQHDAAAGAASAPGTSTDTAAGAHGHASSGDGVPLLPIMRQLAVDMAAMQNALWLENFDEVEERAGAIAEHAHVSGEELARVANELGAEMAAFEAADEAVHQAAVQMHTAASARDTDAILQHLAEVQQGCVACHERFRERLRTVAQ